MAVKALAQQLEIAKKQSDADLGVKHAQRLAATSAAYRDKAQGDLTDQIMRFAYINQPHDLRRIIAEARAAELILPGLENTATFEHALGKLQPGLGGNSARLTFELLKTLRGIRK